MTRPFDWRRDCPPEDVERAFPALVGRGRGVIVGGRVGIRDTLLWLMGRDSEVDPEARRILAAGQQKTYPVERAE